MVNFLGVGAQKCASSWVYEVLKNNDSVNVSDKKELDFFSYNFDKGYEWYESQFSEGCYLAKGEVSPSYFYNTDVPKRAFDYNPDMKIIISLRDPIKRMFSNHLHEVRAGNISEINFEFEKAFVNNPLYLEQSLYIKHIENWRRYFALEQIHFVFQEHVNKNPYFVCKQLGQFLGVDSLSHEGLPAVNASTRDKNRLLGKTFAFAGEIMRRTAMDTQLNRLKESGAISRVYKSNKVHFSELIKPISTEFTRELEKILQPYNDELKTFLRTERLPWEK